MTPDPDDPFEAEGVLNPAAGYTPDGRLHLLPRLVAAGNVCTRRTRRGRRRARCPRRRDPLAASCSNPRCSGNTACAMRSRIPRLVCRAARTHIMTYVAFGRSARGLLFAPHATSSPGSARPGSVRLRTQLGRRSQSVPEQDALFFPEPVPDPQASRATRCCTGRCGGLFGLADDLPPPSGIDERPGHLDLLSSRAAVDATQCAHYMRLIAASPSASSLRERQDRAPPPSFPKMLLIHHRRGESTFDRPPDSASIARRDASRSRRIPPSSSTAPPNRCSSRTPTTS